MTTLATSSSPQASTSHAAESAWEVTRKVAGKVGLATAGIAGVGVSLGVAPGLAILPMGVVDLARSAAGMTTMLGMDDIQFTVSAMFLGYLSASTFVGSKILLDKATELPGKEFWERALKSPLAQKALEVTDKVKKFQLPLGLAAISVAATAAASVAGLATVSLSMPAAMAVGAVGMVGMASLKKLREVRNAKMDSQPSQVLLPPSSGPTV